MPDPPNPILRIVPTPPAPARPPYPFPQSPGSPHPAGSPPYYAELDVTTNFSFLRGASHPDELVFAAAGLGHKAIAVTDRNSLAGAVRMHEAAKRANLKLVVGARLAFADGSPDVLAWAPDRPAYARLCRLLTLGKRRADKGECDLTLADLLAHAGTDPSGTDPGGGTVTAAGGLLLAVVPADPLADNWVGPLRLLRDAAPGRVWLAASRSYAAGDARRLAALADVGRGLGVPLVATNAVHYHAADRRPLQDVLTCVRHGCSVLDAGRRLFANAERHLKPPAQMHRLFADHPAAVRAVVDIVGRCTFTLDQLKYEYPDELVPPGETPAGYLAALAWAGAAGRYPGGVPDDVRRQLDHELKLIGQMKYEAYFLTVHDLVRFARSRGILCQGRGSAANSAVCYCLGVTAVDPVRGGLLFERFVSAARAEPPDIDVDFEHERREEVIQYVYGRYGRDRAALAAEVVTYHGRSAVRDVGKALGLGPELVDALAKQIEGWGRGVPNADQLAALGLDAADPTVRRLTGLTAELLGFPRHLSQHVGGMVMTRGPLADLVPTGNAAMPDRTFVEWDKDDLDALGILKVDVLALGMLTALAKGLRLVNDGSAGPCRPGVPPLELHTIPPQCPATYAMISDADTVGVFQIESRAQMSMLPRLKPRTFYDLVIEVAIVRPGPIQGDMVHPYLRRRQKLEPVTFPKPELEAVLGKTLGVPLFQEQAMKLAMVAGGFTAVEADQLRRAMAAWRRGGALDGFEAKLVEGMVGRGYERGFAEQCFRQIRGFGEYGFPESHAASFALLVYASAWLKRHHPAAFCCALLNSQPMGFYAPAQLVRDAREHGVEVRPADVNHSDWDCTLEPAGLNGVDGFIRPAREGGVLPKGDRLSPISNEPRPSGWGYVGRDATARSSRPTPRPHVNSATDPDAPQPPKATWGRGGPAVRLGLRVIRGLSAAHAERVVRARQAGGGFRSVDHLHRAADL
ncbi:MAG: error-prone polymerase, partial [Phycisphaerales bacterium]|nr:error-prone polymerase [Phycisphaerales bacterium]